LEISAGLIVRTGFSICLITQNQRPAQLKVSLWTAMQRQPAEDCRQVFDEVAAAILRPSDLGLLIALA
jgi:hypothetical protein